MRSILIFLLIILISCSESEKLDLLILSENVYTATESDSSFNAIGVTGERITQIGTEEDLKKICDENTQIVDCRDLFVMPGLIEGHGHFYNLGNSLQNLNFLKDTSWQDILKKVQTKVESVEDGDWIYGRGWHQEKWFIQPDNNFGEYPTHNDLSQITPNNPVLLVHASGHAVFANQKAMDIAGISTESPDPEGGKILKDESGQPIGVFQERASKPLGDAYEAYLSTLDQDKLLDLWYEAIELASQECLENGITSFQDAGTKMKDLKLLEGLASEGKLNLRLWVMLREKVEDIKEDLSAYRKINFGNNYYTCRAIKTELDGALGAHGAWLLEDYTDKPGFVGQNTTPVKDVATLAEIADKNNMQLCVHAIGDKANKETLDIIENYSKDKDLRWRVEHAQHLNPNDINRFKETGAIASMQAVHCTSDAPFVVKRLGTLRSKIGAYAWRELLKNDVVIVNGTDVPVEDIDPIENFFASVTRKRSDNGMEFFVEQRMTREEALRSYTIDAAYGAFEEDIKGSIEVGKLADFTIIDKNWLNCSDEEILDTKIKYTIVGGKIKYEGE